MSRPEESRRPNRLLKYILDADFNPIPCDDLLLWAEWFERGENRRVAWDSFSFPYKAAVSTIFLGLDHNHEMTGAPIL